MKIKNILRSIAPISAYCVLASLASADTYLYNSSVSNWFSASDDLPAFTKYVVKGIGSPTQTFYVTDALNQIEVRSNQSNVNANAVGTYAGARWLAPEQERITSVTFTYQSILDKNLQLSVYVGNGDFDTLLNRIAPTVLVDNRSGGTSVTWVLPEDMVATQLEFRNWDLVAANGVATNWRSSIVSVSIDTVPYVIPEPSSYAAVASVVMVAAVLWLRRR